jgi:hypothetical protein
VVPEPRKTVSPSLTRLALEDGLFGRHLGEGNGSTVHPPDLPRGCQRFEVAPGRCLAYGEIVADLQDADALASQDVFEDLVLTFETGDGGVHLNRS